MSTLATATPRQEDRLTAPWTPAQVATLNEYQQSGDFHPYTRNGKNLIATPDGWVEETGGEIVQDWAFIQSADPNFLAGAKMTRLSSLRSETRSETID